MEVPHEEQGVPVPYQHPQPRIPVPGREGPVISVCKNQQRLRLRMMEVFWSPRKFLLKSPHTDLLRLTFSELQCWGSSLKSTRNREELNCLLSG